MIKTFLLLVLLYGQSSSRPFELITHSFADKNECLKILENIKIKTPNALSVIVYAECE